MMTVRIATDLCFVRLQQFDIPDQNTNILIEEARRGIDDYPIDKLSRWLGYCQAVAIFNQLTSTSAERDFSRPLFEEAYINEGIEIKSFDAGDSR